MRSRATWGAGLLLIVVAGGALRFTALDFGMPDRFRPDEQYIVERAAFFGDARGFDPHSATYPAAQMYVVWAVARTTQAVRGEHWGFSDRLGIRRWYMTARMIGAAMGTLTIVLTALLAEVAVSATAELPIARAAGLVAAALVAGAFLPIRDAHFATTDGPMTFWSTAVWLVLAAVLGRRRSRDSLAAGLLVGLATATKYTAVMLLVPLAGAHFWGDRRLRRLALAGLGGALMFAAASPYVLLDRGPTVAAFAKVRANILTPAATLAPGSLGWVITEAFPVALGWPLAALAVVAVAWALGFGNRLERLLAGWLVLAVLPLVFAGLVFVRYTLLLIPLAMVLVAAGAVRLARHVPGGVPATAVLTVLAVTPGLARAVALDRLLGERDTRTLAREWMEVNLPPGTIVFSPPYGQTPIAFSLPETAPGKYVYAPVPAAGPLPPGAHVLVVEHPLPYAFPTPPAVAALLKERGTILFDIDPFRHDVPVKPRYESVDAFFVPLDGFAAVERPGPRLVLYRLPASG